MRWFITGCSSGLGLEIARAALDAGQIVVASSRHPETTPEIVAEIEGRGGRWIALDTAGKDVEKTIVGTIDKYGPIDVLVNNAGFAIGGPLETHPMESSQQLFAANFFGPIRTLQAVLPSMRERKTGTIVNVSSAEFWIPHAGVSIYAASKFAIEGVSEALREEVAEFGIRVLIAEPGGMRTAFIDPTKSQQSPARLGAYKGTMADYVIQEILSLHGNQSLDPRKVASAIVKEVLEPTLNEEDKPMLRLPLGQESLAGMRARAKEFRLTADIYEKVAVQCDFPQ